MDTVGWEFWILRAALVGAFGVALVLIDRLFVRVKNWLTWTLRFCVLFGLSCLAIAYDLSLPAGETGTGLWLVGGIGMIVGLFGIPISVVRWVDTWDHGLPKNKPRPKEPAAEVEAAMTILTEQMEGQAIPEYSIEEARLRLAKAVDLANEKLLIDRLYAVAKELTDLHALIEADDDLDDPDDADYPMFFAELNIGWHNNERSLEIGIGDRAFDMTFCGNDYAPKLDHCRRVIVSRDQNTLGDICYVPTKEDLSPHRKWRVTDVAIMQGTAWLDELEQLAASYIERGKLFEGYRLRKSNEAERLEVIERAKKIWLDD